MDSQVTIESLLSMAEQIEHYGAEFYREAAGRAGSPETRNELQKLAEMEMEHEQFFSNMKSKYAKYKIDSVVQDSDNKIGLYIKAISDGKIFNFSTALKQHITGNETLKDILNIAIELEKDSIVFFTGLASLISEKSFNEVLNQIIREEISHLAILANIPIL